MRTVRTGSYAPGVRPPGSPFLDSRTTLLVGPTFLWLAQPDHLGQGETIRACTSAVCSGIFSYRRLLK